MPVSAASSRLSNFDYLNTTSDEDQPGAMPSSAPPMSPLSSAPMPSTPAPMQQQGLPSVGDLEPDWGHGSGESHLSEGPDWGSHPMMTDPDWTARRKGFMFRRLSLQRR
jgi:hypothetical protein